MLQLLEAGSVYRGRSPAINNAEHHSTTAQCAKAGFWFRGLHLHALHPLLLQLTQFRLKALQLSGQSLGQLYTTCENVDVNKIVLFCIGNDVTERHALFYSLYGSPCYDRGPVVHDWKCDDKQPVVIQIPSRVDDKYFFWPKT